MNLTTQVQTWDEAGNWGIIQFRFQVVALRWIHHPGSLLVPCRSLRSWHFLCFFADPTWPYLWHVKTSWGMYPLVNVYITMENHHFQWENPLFLWPFSIAMLVITRGYWGYNGTQNHVSMTDHFILSESLPQAHCCTLLCLVHCQILCVEIWQPNKSPSVILAVVKN